jgi:drug/metabolite transporter (DMT)-like permease
LSLHVDAQASVDAARLRTSIRAGLPNLTVPRLSSGIAAALVSALLFGISTPLAKILVAGVPPVALAGLLYLGSGIGLLTSRSLRQWASVSTDPREAPLAGGDWG